LITDDPPRHRRFRPLVNKAFTLRRIEALTPWITAVASELLDDLVRDETDLVQHYAIPLPVKVIARLLGIPGDDYQNFKRWSDAFIAVSRIGDTERARGIQEMIAYFGKTVAARRAHGAEDLITALVETEVEGEKLGEGEIRILLLVVTNPRPNGGLSHPPGMSAGNPPEAGSARSWCDGARFLELKAGPHPQMGAVANARGGGQDYGPKDEGNCLLLHQPNEVELPRLWREVLEQQARDCQPTAQPGGRLHQRVMIHMAYFDRAGARVKDTTVHGNPSPKPPTYRKALTRWRSQLWPRLTAPAPGQ
jgi:hypothetical protein